MDGWMDGCYGERQWRDAMCGECRDGPLPLSAGNLCNVASKYRNVAQLWLQSSPPEQRSWDQLVGNGQRRPRTCDGHSYRACNKVLAHHLLAPPEQRDGWMDEGEKQTTEATATAT